MSELLTPSPSERTIRRRKVRDPKPRFRAARTAQLDAVQGCAELALPAGHLARQVREWVARLDVSAVEARYSSLGTRGFRPASTLGVWVYASLVGVHASTALARRMATDMALRWLGDGYAMSAGHLRKFRRENRALFQSALQQTVTLAVGEGLLEPEELAVDSVRLRAEASSSQVRTVERSQKRLKELGAVDVEALATDGAREAHARKVHKHEEALARCEEAGRTNVVLSNPAAGLMAFPSGASAPGHRVSACVAGVRARLVVSVLIDASATDAGLLGPVLLRARAALLAAGVPLTQRLQVAADAGYFGEKDLTFAREAAPWVDVLVAPKLPQGRKAADGGRLFGPEAFDVDVRALTARCPAGRPMLGPFQEDVRTYRWRGQDCAHCPLKARCTLGQQRSLKLDLDAVEARDAMRARMAQPGAAARYAQRIATVEPAFSYLEDTMGFRRVASRKPEAASAEILLKLLAYNLSRLAAAKRLLCVRLWLEPCDDGTWLMRLASA